MIYNEILKISARFFTSGEIVKMDNYALFSFLDDEDEYLGDIENNDDNVQNGFLISKDNRFRVLKDFVAINIQAFSPSRLHCTLEEEFDVIGIRETLTDDLVKEIFSIAEKDRQDEFLSVINNPIHMASSENLIKSILAAKAEKMKEMCFSLLVEISAISNSYYSSDDFDLEYKISGVINEYKLPKSLKDD
jgi:hypothetical protein